MPNGLFVTHKLCVDNADIGAYRHPERMTVERWIPLERIMKAMNRKPSALKLLFERKFIWKWIWLDELTIMKVIMRRCLWNREHSKRFGRMPLPAESTVFHFRFLFPPVACSLRCRRFANNTQPTIKRLAPAIWCKLDYLVQLWMASQTETIQVR